ncbi:MAG: hypothetical protein Q8M07_13795 [Prosthecobacter sp.]|nr:hypothetical protein [Prosthecobacter sp.]
MKIIGTSLSLCSIMLITGCKEKDSPSSNNSASTQAPSILYPLVEGNQWMYLQTIESDAPRKSTVFRHVSATTPLGGHDHMLVRTEGLREWMRFTPEGLIVGYLARGNAPPQPIMPPQFCIKLPLSAGNKWEWSGEDKRFGEVVHNYLNEGSEDITTPFGKTFKTTRISLKIYRKGAAVPQKPVLTLTRWFAPDVGIIKEVEQTNDPAVTTTLELATLTNERR